MPTLTKDLCSIGFACLMAFTTAAQTGIDTKNKAIAISLATDPPTLDTSLIEDTVSAVIANAVNEGLVRVDQRGRILPGVAERWEVSGTRATFWLRKDARWSDGSPVTAHDFVFAWRRLVDPKTGASGSANFAYVLDNATQILAGEKPASSLGVSASDDMTLNVQLSGPIPFFVDVVLGTAYYPLKESFVNAQGQRYAADAAKILYNGPFELVEWKRGASIKMAKNPHYWAKDEVHLNQINVDYITSDQRSLMNLFANGELAELELDETTMREAAKSGLKMRQSRTSCVGLITPNLREGRATANQNVRAAIRAVFDPETYTNRVIAVPANRPAASLFPSYLQAYGKPFQSVFEPAQAPVDSDAAKRLILAARKELVDVPPVTLLAWEGTEKQVEYLQGILKEHLDLDVRIDKQTFKQAISRLIAGDFDLALSRFCGGSMRDPAFFASILESTGTFNDGRFANAEYDQLMAQTRETDDPNIRMPAFGRMQQIIFDEIAVIPTHEMGGIYVQDDRLVGVVRWPGLDHTRAAVR